MYFNDVTACTHLHDVDVRGRGSWQPAVCFLTAIFWCGAVRRKKRDRPAHASHAAARLRHDALAAAVRRVALAPTQTHSADVTGLPPRVDASSRVAFVMATVCLFVLLASEADVRVGVDRATSNLLPSLLFTQNSANHKKPSDCENSAR